MDVDLSYADDKPAVLDRLTLTVDDNLDYYKIELKMAGSESFVTFSNENGDKFTAFQEVSFPDNTEVLEIRLRLIAKDGSSDITGVTLQVHACVEGKNIDLCIHILVHINYLHGNIVIIIHKICFRQCTLHCYMLLQNSYINII